MAYFYQFELILVGIILLSTMSFAGIKIWLRQRKLPEESEIKKANFTDQID